MRLQEYPFVRNLRKRVNDKYKLADIYKELKRVREAERGYINTTSMGLLNAFVWVETPPQGAAYWRNLWRQYGH